MSKKYTSTISVIWEGNMLEVKNKEEYIKQLKQGFLEEYGILLSDNNITNVELKNE